MNKRIMRNQSDEAPPPKYWSQLLNEVAKTKSEQAFAKLHAHFTPLIRHFINGQSAGLRPDTAEEITQEVMMKVWFKAEKYDIQKAAASTWIFTLARNARIDYFRKHARHELNSDSLDTVGRDDETHNAFHSIESLSTEDIWDEDEFNQPFIDLNKNRIETHIHTLLSNIPSDQRHCLQKVYMEGKSHTEIAGELDLPLGTVKSRVRLGLKRLQSFIAER